MSVPGIVQSSLNGEQVAAQVPLGGDDFLFVTPSRTLIYRADGLLSDESVEEFPHEAERVELSKGRRKATVTLDYGLDGSRSFSVGAKRVDDALHPVLAGVLRAAGITEPDETVKQTFLFSELTLIVSSQRVVKHVGSAVWDEDFEEYPYDDVTSLTVEEGSVASQIVIEVEGRPQRTKAPNDQARHVHEQVQEALLDHHGYGSYAEFELNQADPEEEDEAESADADTGAEESNPFGEGVEPLSANPPELDSETGEKVEVEEVQSPTSATASDSDPLGMSSTEATTEKPAEPTAVEQSPSFEGSAFEPAASDTQDDEVAAELARLAAAVERQSEQLAKQQATIEQLIDELSRGR